MDYGGEISGFLKVFDFCGLEFFVDLDENFEICFIDVGYYIFCDC